MIEDYVPSNHQNDNFYERFMQQRSRDLNNPSITEEHDSFPFPIEPLRSILSTNDLVCIVTILELLLHLLLLAPLCYHLQFLRKLQPLIHLFLSMHKLFNCRPGNMLVQFNNLFVRVPPAWLQIVLNRSLKSPNKFARSQITRILSQY